MMTELAVEDLTDGMEIYVEVDKSVCPFECIHSGPNVVYINNYFISVNCTHGRGGYPVYDKPLKTKTNEAKGLTFYIEHEEEEGTVYI